MYGPSGSVRLGSLSEHQAQSASAVRRVGQRTRRERQLQGSAGGVHLQRGDVGLQRGLSVSRRRAQTPGTAGRPEQGPSEHR